MARRGRYKSFYQMPSRGKPRAMRASQARKCTEVTFKRAKAGGRVLPRSQWVTTVRCSGKKLKAHNRSQARRCKAKTFRCRQFVAR